MATYRVVNFDDEGAVECVPSNWIFRVGDEVRCYWPKKNLQRRLSSAEAPDKNSKLWAEFPCRVIGHSEYGDFKTARMAAKRAESTSNIDDSQEEETIATRRENRKPGRYRLSGTEESSSDEDVPAMTERPGTVQLPMAPTYQLSKGPASKQKSNQIDSQEPTASKQNSYQINSQEPTASKQKSNQIDSQEPTASTSKQTASTVTIDDAQLETRSQPQSQSSLQATSIGSSNRNTLPDLTGSTSNNVTEVLVQVFQKLEYLQETTDKIAKVILKVEDSRSMTVRDLVPAVIDTKEDFESFEAKLEDKVFRKDLVTILAKMMGGPDLAPIVRCVMRALLGNKLMSTFSFTGQRGKVAFRDTRTYQIILRAIRKITKDQCKMNDYNYEISEVLRNAPNYPGGVNFEKREKGKKRKRQSLPALPESDSD